MIAFKEVIEHDPVWIDFDTFDEYLILRTKIENLGYKNYWSIEHDRNYFFPTEEDNVYNIVEINKKEELEFHLTIRLYYSTDILTYNFKDIIFESE